MLYEDLPKEKMILRKKLNKLNLILLCVLIQELD